MLQTGPNRAMNVRTCCLKAPSKRLSLEVFHLERAWISIAHAVDSHFLVESCFAPAEEEEEEKEKLDGATMKILLVSDAGLAWNCRGQGPSIRKESVGRQLCQSNS
mmetsp:Transcript_17480/g.37403  ORF Transcript_17480/g.37403 Transcript_17480/m.37403 type:complete len:106 (-) Transcript_17480:360-677(-)